MTRRKVKCWMDHPADGHHEDARIGFGLSFSALCVAVGYGKGLALSSLPSVVEFMSVLIFLSGLTFGSVGGALNGAFALAIYMVVPYLFAHPAAWLFTVSPTLLVVMAGLGA